MKVQTEIPGYFRDTKTQVVINKNTSELQAYELRKKEILNKNKETAEIQELKSEISDIKKILMELLNKNG